MANESGATPNLLARFSDGSLQRFLGPFALIATVLETGMPIYLLVDEDAHVVLGAFSTAQLAEREALLRHSRLVEAQSPRRWH